MGRKLQIGHIFGEEGKVGPIGVAASQKFCYLGGKFVYLDSSGHVTIAVAAQAYLFGWALTPMAPHAGSSVTGASTYWTSSATAGADKVMIINDLDAVFCIGVTGTMADARVGEAYDISAPASNDGLAQTLDLATSDDDVVLVVGMFAAGDTGYAFVKLNPNEIQKDT